jgi:nitroimidazol reductase NimA-like FMN-containing flavoprotein (pyridoxamine 5'-phosphate oxidase superfamily)
MSEPLRYARTERTRIRRLPKRAAYDRATVHAILDEGLVAHVAFAADGQPFVVPMAYARIGEMVVIHGSVISRLMTTLAEGVPVNVVVTLLDGLVLARSAFHSSMNYRSVSVFGVARPITDPAAKREALDALTDKLVPGRVARLRPPTAKELRATLVLELPLGEAVAKTRVGPPSDDAGDLSAPVWAGVLPLKVAVGKPVDAPDLAPGIAPGDDVRRWPKGRAA